MAKLINFEKVHSHAAGIDMGAAEIFVSPDGQEVKTFSTFTSGYQDCVKYLRQQGIREVAMEATGVYWISLYMMLEDSGFYVCLVNPQETKQVKGRKTDMKDCRWIQKLFSAGILRESFVPKTDYMEVRQLVRHRATIIEAGSDYVNRMQKYLELMNLKLKEVIDQIHGVSGIKMIKAIIAGQRDKQVLLELCDPRIRNKKGDQVIEALNGHYNETYLSLLASSLHLWELHQQEVGVIDGLIENKLHQLADGQVAQLKSTPKRIRHHAPKVKNLHGLMVNLYGVNMSSLSGLNDYTLLRLLGETGVAMNRFPTEKHFASWCGLSPKHHQSGKTNKRVKGTRCNKAGQIFKECAQSLMASKDIAIGAFMRKLKAKKDSSIAIKAGARKLAIAYYNGLTRGAEYVEQGVKQYETLIKNRELQVLQKLAKKHNMQLAQNHSSA